ncbi:Cgi121p PWA37_004013 [Arxiozyma heterogenica]|uniref:EKC/KEOPS complex subunit CGI121 n=1 Tax=Arxiozyma heterogenica TaxID=278026 RepID=A0AAN7ZS51_9SACH|nr:hypothetical protein RI543_003044 [Kazachstania heterogenica]
MLETTIPQFQDFTIKIYLFKDVKNSKEIRSNVAEYPFAFINGRTICSLEQIMAALYRVLIEKHYNKIRTKSLTSECLLCLAPTSNIGEVFKRFGLKDDTREIVCVEIIKVNNNTTDHISIESIVQGTEIEVTDDHLKQFCDKDLIRDIYKFDPSFQLSSMADLTRAVVNSIQLRGL